MALVGSHGRSAVDTLSEVLCDFLIENIYEILSFPIQCKLVDYFL